MLNSLSIALIKFASPGVPDIYQGNELIDLRLVDPDNRVPVDYGLRRTRLAELEALTGGSAAVPDEAIAGWFADPGNGLAKLWITHRLLQLRRVHPELLATGDYLPVNATGSRGGNIVAFARRQGSAGAIAVAGRLFASLDLAPGVVPVGTAAWGDTMLDLDFLPPDTALVNVLTGETLIARDGRLPMAAVFGRFPGAVLRYAPRG